MSGLPMNKIKNGQDKDEKVCSFAHPTFPPVNSPFALPIDGSVIAAHRGTSVIANVEEKVLTTCHLLTGQETFVSAPIFEENRDAKQKQKRSSRVRCEGRIGKHQCDQKVKIDFLSLSTPLSSYRIKRLFQILLLDVVMTERGFGYNGYPESANLKYKGIQIGLFGWGATQHRRNFISFSGAGCSRVKNWPLFHHVLEKIRARITRVDLAFDLYKGELTYEDCEAAAFPDNPDTAGGEFINPKGGPQRLSFKRYSSGGALGNLGRTLSIGGRKSSKSICIYEKGLEQFGKLPLLWDREKDDPTIATFTDELYGCPGGTEVKQWLRLEVRYTNTDRVLDNVMVIEPDRYFAGAYPFCARVIKRSDGMAPSTMMSSAEIELEKLIHYCRVSYGSLLHTLHTVNHLSKEEVFDKLVKEIVSPKLKRSGVLSEPLRVFKTGYDPVIRKMAPNSHALSKKRRNGSRRKSGDPFSFVR